MTSRSGTALASILAEGYNDRPYVHGAVERLGIPGIRFVDGPRGCVAGAGTAFPVPMARGATWDLALEERVGEVIGREIRAQGGNLFGGVCVNLLRHPAWVTPCGAPSSRQTSQVTGRLFTP
ncbi:glycoside hydrolase family 3 N-terminal domain-containing protein [Streptomyces sp. NBC_00572]|uniref:glycoside hydrolase family 3 N-terminal domain-containing protein n=1 Tax=Streptomyces sp. NBC_00572 TaxID=2903664 RepID=UPI002253D4EC|nr:glycoside hydrolase family 3 N-terminal domain-containing protein [Streptomyces sp. NBC_00572]MCX4984329.1 hypothetical protein [Streptomyces sp. NBC_00572]